MMQWQSGPQLSALIILPSIDHAGSSAARAMVGITATATAIMAEIVFMASYVQLIAFEFRRGMTLLAPNGEFSQYVDLLDFSWSVCCSRNP
jgi:hypothetical protein